MFQISFVFSSKPSKYNMDNRDGDGERNNKVVLKSDTNPVSYILWCLDTGHFSDVVLVGENGGTVSCHRLVLASASAYLRQLLQQQHTGRGV